ncbi:type II toxin-antitoxin system VapC family toxin [Sphingomonas gilva]|uniref:Type II toxin-antitoxin system VapC family toxin n=1 Tax=Sphingomonas gilva TaxID=2305907 RepID=A0A396S077_9SPHN|nr:type II toxin-antitoxin system VapC family toxin [Sphingomonas gilva]RHW16745.1 type II toxin-antitoxin system VapC family toxin [Sphingomonas gilva]
MRLLLDTHALIWWMNDDRQLSRPAFAAIADPDNIVLVSAISALELAIKNRLGKIPEAQYLALNFEDEVEAAGFEQLPVVSSHARRGGAPAIPHRDPFDRILIAQAQSEDATLVSNEAIFDQFGVQRLW